jgi:hypothetical protein
MNKKSKIIEESKLINLIDKSSIFGREGCVKCWKGVTKEHFITMAGVCWKLVNQGYRVFTEVIFKSGGRADIVAISGSDGFVIEILHSESEEKFSKKEDLYPSEFTIIPIKTKDFDLDKFYF